MIRRAIELLVTGVIRSRIGLAVLLAVVVLGIVGAAQLVSGPSDDGSGPVGAPIRPISTVDPTEGDDGLTATEEPAPRTSPGAPDPEAVARSFAAAWLAHRDVTPEQWHAALRPLSTADLAEKLAGVDPAGVPADRLTGDPAVIPRNDSLVEVIMPVDSGELRLSLVAADGRWRVDGIDWSRT